MTNININFNDIVSEINNEMVEEAVRFFSIPHKRLRPDSQRFFYKKSEVEAILSRIDRATVRVDIEPNDWGGIFCYILTPVCSKENRVYNGRTTKKSKTA